MSDLNGAVFAASLGVEPTDADIAAIDAPAGRDPTAYRAMVREHLNLIAVYRAAGRHDEASRAADELLHGHELALTLSPPDHAGQFAAWLSSQIATEETND